MKLFSYKLAVACVVSGWVLSGLGTCYANIGDGYQAAAQRWGQPTSRKTVNDGSSVHYESNGWLINEFYDASGSSVAICYYKPAIPGKELNFITNDEFQRLWRANLPTEGIVHWAYLPESTNTRQMWYCAEIKEVAHLEVNWMDDAKAWISCAIFATNPVGVTMLVNDNKPAPTEPTVRQQPINDGVTQFSTREHPLV
jgi:hypothetical protein